MIFDRGAGNVGDRTSPIENRVVNVDKIFSRVKNIKILQRNFAECNSDTVLAGNPRFFCLKCRQLKILNLKSNFLSKLIKYL